MNTLNDLNRKFNDEKTKAANQEAELMTAAGKEECTELLPTNADHTLVSAQVTGFANCFDSITKTIDAAIVSIGKMSCKSSTRNHIEMRIG